MKRSSRRIESMAAALLALSTVHCQSAPAAPNPAPATVTPAPPAAVPPTTLFGRGAEDAVRDIHLPAPDTTGGRPLMQVLRDRQSSRTFAARPLPLQVVSELLWATGGVNRPERGLRTAPTARNWQEIDVFVTTVDGAWRYEPVGHVLRFVHGRDVRAATGLQPFVADAPLNLVYVADHAKMGDTPPERRQLYAGADTAFMAQNAYLYCASAGLATVVRGHLDAVALAHALSLGPERVPTLAQTIGYPAE